jgi:hypothetical protein
MVTFDCSKYHPQPQILDTVSLKSLFVTQMEGDPLNEMSD